MFDFTTVPNRRGGDSIKWSGPDNELPMWIADMDFQTAPAVIEALQQKVATGIFGYEEPPHEYFQAVSDWYETRHHAAIPLAWQLFATGVIPALSASIRRVTNAGDNVVVQTPVYNMFFNSIENAGRHVLPAELAYDHATHTYHIDWHVLESTLAEPLTTAMVLCNPHNPIGQIWTRDQLTHIAELCKQYGVTLIADEIHGDLTLNGHEYTPTFSLPEALRQNLITLVSPSKAFNLAAIHAATVIVSNPTLRANIARGLGVYEVNEPNLTAIPASIAAYTKGAEWFDALRQQLNANLQTVQQFDLGEAIVTPATATYLLWLDISAYTHDSAKLAEFLETKVGLKLNAGADYRGNGHDFLRLNIACPQSLLQEGLTRLQQGLNLYRKEFND